LIPEHIWAADVSSVFTWVIASYELIVVIRMCSYNLKIPNPKGKIKWGKTDKDLHRAMVTESQQHCMNTCE
jgi:hypothetical protein